MRAKLLMVRLPPAKVPLNSGQIGSLFAFFDAPPLGWRGLGTAVSFRRVCAPPSMSRKPLMVAAFPDGCAQLASFTSSEATPRSVMLSLYGGGSVTSSTEPKRRASVPRAT
jgi:hypothetical protein